jgi:hypothetical protein
VAHIALNHKSARVGKNAASAIDEHSVIQGEWKDSSDLRDHALELDADVHAIEWTREHFEFTWAHQSKSSLEAAARAVQNSFLATSNGIRFLVVVGAWIALLTLDAKVFKPKRLTSGTHPLAAVRMAVLLHLENELNTRRTQSASDVQAAAANLVLCSYAVVSITEQKLESLRHLSPDEAFTRVREPLEVAKRNCGLAGVFACWTAVGDTAAALARERNTVEVELARNRRVSSDHVVHWFD